MVASPSSAPERDVFHFFDNLIRRGGLTRLKRAFMAGEDESSSHYIRYNPESNSLEGIKRDRETGEWEDYSLRFDEDLFQRLKPEFDGVVACIDHDFRSKESVEGAEVLSKYYLNQIDRLQKELSRYDEEEGRELVKTCLNRLAEEVRLRQDSFSVEDQGSSVRSDDGRVKHMENKPWVIDRWNELQREHPNATYNRCLEMLTSDYQEKFEGEPPSFSTLRRYVGLR